MKRYTDVDNENCFVEADTQPFHNKMGYTLYAVLNNTSRTLLILEANLDNENSFSLFNSIL